MDNDRDPTSPTTPTTPSEAPRTTGDVPPASADRDTAPAGSRSDLLRQAGTHPLGTPLGALAGGAVGALIGLAAGPVGSLAGAVLGAAAGMALGAGGRQTRRPPKQPR